MSTSQDQARTRTNTIEDDDATTVCTAHDRRREAPLDAVEHDVAEASAAATNAMGVGATSVMTAGATSVMGTGAAPTGGPSPATELAGGHSPYAAYLGSPDTHIGATQPIAVRKGLFEGISIAQVIAASAAAATSMLLASRIGIAGSVIGAAVSSMITVICSQLYRNALDASAQKLKAKQASSGLAHGTAMSASAATEPNGTVAAPYAARLEGRDLTARIAPTKLQARAAAERSATKRKVAVVSVVIAVAAVAASAGIIMLTTSGEGLGVKVPSLFASTDQQAVAPEDPADELASSTPTPQDTGAPSTDGQLPTSRGRLTAPQTRVVRTRRAERPRATGSPVPTGPPRTAQPAPTTRLPATAPAVQMPAATREHPAAALRTAAPRTRPARAPASPAPPPAARRTPRQTPSRTPALRT